MARGNTSVVASQDAVSLLAAKWDTLPSLEKRDALVKAMREIGNPCLISYALSADGQMKPIAYKMSENEKVSVLANRQWPCTVREVMNLEGFADETFPESKVKEMRLKMGSQVIYGEHIWDILCDDTVSDIRVSMGGSSNGSSPSQRVQQPVQTPAAIPASDNPRKRLPGESFKEQMARLKAMDREGSDRAAGRVPNGGSVATMPIPAVKGRTRSSGTLNGAIVKAGGTLPAVATRAKEEYKVASHGNPADALASLISSLSLSEGDVREVVREEIGKALALLLSHYPVVGGVQEDE